MKFERKELLQDSSTAQCLLSLQIDRARVFPEQHHAAS